MHICIITNPAYMIINEVGFPSNSGRFLSTWLSSSFVTFSSRKSALSACFLINDRPMTIGSAVVQWLSKVEKNWLTPRSINSCCEQRENDFIFIVATSVLSTQCLKISQKSRIWILKFSKILKIWPFLAFFNIDILTNFCPNKSGLSGNPV